MRARVAPVTRARSGIDAQLRPGIRNPAGIESGLPFVVPGVGVVFLLYVIVEIAAVVAVASAVGVGWMLLLLLAGGVLGFLLARREGRRAFGAVTATVRSGGSPHAEVTDGLLVSVGGVLIMLPGFVSDVAGFAFLLPPTRALLRRRWVRSMERHSPDLRTARMRGTGTVVDGEVVDEPPQQQAQQQRNRPGDDPPRIIDMPSE